MFRSVSSAVALTFISIQTAAASVVGSAQIVETISPIIADVSHDGSSTVVTSEPVATSQMTQTGDDAFFAQAVVNTGGSAQLTVENTNESHIAWSGDGSQQTVRAIADYFVTYKNTGTTQVFGIFSYTISDIYLATFNYGGGAPTAKVSHQFNVEVGDSPAAFSAELELTGNYNDFQITSASGFQSPTVERKECVYDVCNAGVANVSPLTKSYSLGILDPGEFVTLYYSLSVETGFSGTEVGAIARANDPGGPVFTAIEVGTPPTGVPLPPTMWMLATGLLGLIGVRRRKVA